MISIIKTNESKEVSLKIAKKMKAARTIGVPWVFVFSVNDMRSQEDLYNVLYNIAMGINEVFSNYEYVQLIRMAITEVTYNIQIDEMLDSVITRPSLAIVTNILSQADNMDILSVSHPELQARSFVGGLLVGFYSDGLLSSRADRLHRFNHKELVTYVATCMQVIV